MLNNTRAMRPASTAASSLLGAWPVFPAAVLAMLLGALLGAIVLLTGGCEAPQSAVNVPAAEPEPEPAPAVDAAVVARLLEQAEQAFDAEHLTYPEEGSALALFQQVLAMVPDQEQAQRGLERIVEHHVEMAMHALDRGQYATARSMLTRARLILPDHPSIEPSAEQIRLLSEAERTRVQFSQADLQAQTPALVETLHSLARVESAAECRFVIRAKSDGQGRWIYQTLSQGQNGARLRAQIEIALPASVERLCFKQTGDSQAAPQDA